MQENLYTANEPDPDLLIRPGGELRISNFLLWQLAYTEFVFIDKYWPDFTEEDLLEAIKVLKKEIENLVESKINLEGKKQWT